MGDRSGRRWVGAAVGVGTLTLVPMVAGAQSIGPSTITESSAPARTIASVILVWLVGAAFLARSEGFVDRAVDDTMDRPAVGIVYGLFAYVLVLFFSLYATDLLTRIGVAGTPLGYGALAILGGGILVLGGLGYLVVGTLVTDVHGSRRPWYGLLLGAVLSGLGWLVLPPVAAVAAWIFVTALGLGGPTRTWVHNERAVRVEPDR